MSNSQQHIKNNVMRRVYYAYTLRILTHPRTLHAVVAGVLLYALTFFVSIGDVVYNLSLVRVYQIDSFLYSAFVHTELGTLLVLAALAVLTYSFVRNVRHVNVPRMRFMQHV